MVNRRSNSASNSSGNQTADNMTYEQIMGEEGGHEALSSRLVSFRNWVQNAGCKVHSAVCIVNGEATDGTRNAPVLILGPPPSSNPSKPVATAEGRCGLVDTDEDRVLYDRTIGCQIRTAREMKEGQVLMNVPKSVMVHPDLIAASDAGRVALSCVEPLESGSNYWDAFHHTGEKQKAFLDKTMSNKGTQLIVKILQERKKVETVLTKAAKAVEEGNIEYKLAPKGSISTRAAVLLFLIQQRFSDELEPSVSSEYNFGNSSSKVDASESLERLECAPGTPHTFAPYARTLPPSVPLPMCWKRNELAILASCIPGLSTLQEVAAQIMTLASDLIALVDAGILHRFPSLFSQKQLTWDRWLWAASVHTSRLLPATCYLNKNEEKAANHLVREGEMFYSPPQVWDDLGVMVPLIDMLNHEVEESQIKWESPAPPKIDDDEELLDEGIDDDTTAKVVIQKRVKKGAQIYTTYGFESNQNLMLTYGFAQMSNDADTIQIGWALSDGVGNIPKPEGFVPMGQIEGEKDARGYIFESTDKEAVNNWWTEDRLEVLKHEIKSDSNFWESLRGGKRMTTSALSNGTYQPILLTAMTVATMSTWAIRQHKDKIAAANGNIPQIILTKRHQRALNNYMLFFFTRKLERLLQNLSSGLKAHFNNINLWTKASEGGLDYNNAEGIDNNSEHSQAFIGWNSFFDTYAYNAAMEIETRYYSLAPDSCVLTLYDGNLRALQKSIDGVRSEEAFKEKVCTQLEELGFGISDEDHEEDVEDAVIVIDDKDADMTNNKEENGNAQSLEKDEAKKDEKMDNGGSNSGEKKERKRNRQRNRMKPGGPPAIKLHIGNLSYQTVPSRMFDFFAMRYGRDSVLECHIPTERETGKSRGFGFVTMPEAVALRILNENLPHEIDGRVVKLAESNTSVQARSGQNGATMNAPSDRCAVCGYRPRYCTCQPASMPGFHGGMHGGPMPMIGGPPPGHMYPPDDIYGPGPGPGGPGPGPGQMPPGDMSYGRGGMHPDYDPHRGRGRSRSIPKGRSYSRSPSSRYRRRGDSRDRHYDRRHRDRRGRSFSRSRSRSRDRRDRGRDRDWDRDSRRSSRRSRGSSRRSSRYSRSRSLSRSRSRSPSYSKDTSSISRRDRDRKPSGSSNGESANAPRGDRNRSRSRSQSLSGQERGSEVESNKREGGKSSRRARSKSRDRNSRSRKRSSKGSRRSKESSKRHSRSRSF